eukprot:497980_1
MDSREVEQIAVVQLAEKLISTVVRAFFDDEKVLLIDTLFRLKYVRDKDDDLGARLGLSPKQVRSALAELRQEGLCDQEFMPDELQRGRNTAYWYVDLRRAVGFIRLRVHFIQKRLREAEKREMALQTYICPQCGNTFSVLEIQKLLNGSKGFCCSHCCPNDVHTTCSRDTPYSLRDNDNHQRLEAATKGLTQFKEQLSESTLPGLERAGIIQMVKQLHNKAIPSNLPSELRDRGVEGNVGQYGDGASRLARFQDDTFSLHSQYAESSRLKERNAMGTRAMYRGGERYMELISTKNALGQEVLVQIEDNSDDDEELGSIGLISARREKIRAQDEAATAAEEKKKARKSAPEFLSGSRIASKYTAAIRANGNREELQRTDEEEGTKDIQRQDGAAAVCVKPEPKTEPSHETLSAAKNKPDLKTELERQEQQLVNNNNCNVEPNGQYGDEIWMDAANRDGDDQDVLEARIKKKAPCFLIGQREIGLTEVTENDLALMSKEQYEEYYAATTSIGGKRKLS